MIIRVRKVGNSLCVTLPSQLCRRHGIKHGTYFDIKDDVILIDVFTFTKLEDNLNRL